MTGMEPMLIMSAVSAASQAVQNSRASKASKNQVRYQQQVADRNKSLAKIEADRQEKITREKAKSAAAQARVRMGASGIQSTGGSAQALLRGIRSAQDNNIAEIRFNSQIQQQNQQIEATQSRHQSNLANKTRNQNFALSSAVKLADILTEEKPDDATSIIKEPTYKPR